MGEDVEPIRVLVRDRGRAGGARRGFRMGTPVRDPSARSRESAGGARLVAAFPGRRRTAGSGWRSFGEYLNIKDSCYKVKGQSQLLSSRTRSATRTGPAMVRIPAWPVKMSANVADAPSARRSALSDAALENTQK
jgi:hypothetical protein